MAHHRLKTWPEYYQAVESGEKTFEVRYNDRAYKAGDTLELCEYDPGLVPMETGYTGRHVVKRVSYVLHGGGFGVERGYVVMGLTNPEEF